MTDLSSRDASQWPFSQDGIDGLVHDLGNYIQIAMSAVRLVSTHSDIIRSDTLGNILAQAQDSLQRAGALVRLSNARFDELPAEDLSVDDCLMEIAPLLRVATGPAVTIRLHVGLVPKVRINRIGLQNALLNLAINARDAMPGGGTLSVSALLADGPEAPEVEIVVADDGIGMSPAVLERALEPRFTTKPAGTGMGLFSLRTFVEAVGGRVAIASTEGAGTRVSLRLPIAL